MSKQPSESDSLLVVDILRSSVNDGPGIRTTVFTKGCPLRCAWCHNPESMLPVQQISFDAGRCILCHACEESCPEGAHSIHGAEHALDRDKCKLCGTCTDVCPAAGLKIVGTWWTPQAVVDLVLRDKPYYDRSGGGLTISGGEPMTQFSAVSRVLRLAKSAGVHTCLDTCGQTSSARYLEILPLVDLFLWDYKATGPDVHKNLTGVDGRLIRANLQTLHDAGAKIRLRCPLIPGVNDTPEHLREIARLDQGLPGLDGIDIMAYHSYARDKAARVGMAQPPMPEQSADEPQIAGWLEQIHAHGGMRVTRG